jgi:hypothetical protein
MTPVVLLALHKPYGVLSQFTPETTKIRPNMKTAQAAIFAFCALTALRAEIQLRGVMKTDNAYLFSLLDTESQSSSSWVTIGSVFRGYTVVRYDQERDLVRLKKGDLEIEAKLQATHVKHAPESPVDVRSLSNEELESLGLYRLKAGDTAAKIARALKINVAALLALNPGVEFTRLRVGQILIVSAEAPPDQHPEAAK